MDVTGHNVLLCEKLEYSFSNNNKKNVDTKEYSD